VGDPCGVEALEQRIELADHERDPARADVLGAGLDEQRRVLVDVPQDLVARAHIRLASRTAACTNRCSPRGRTRGRRRSGV
jgi:hypothetical protein